MEPPELSGRPAQAPATEPIAGRAPKRAVTNVNRTVRRTPTFWFRCLVHAICIAPAVWFAAHYLTGGASANPLQEATYFTGDWALRFVVASLACTPLNSMFGFKPALKVRRALGLYGFFYAFAHFFIFIGIDYQFDLQLIWLDLASKRYVLVGLAALLIFAALAITSTRLWMKRLGKRWKVLHRLVYLAIPLAVVHYIWLVKADIRTPVVYGIIAGTFLILRVPAVRSTMARLLSPVRRATNM